MKKLFFILISLGLMINLKAQDQLFKKDGSRLLVRVSEVTPDEVKYKPYSNLNGPVYVVDKSNIVLIIYENGTSEVINSTTNFEVSRTYCPPVRPAYRMSRTDSSQYYKHSSSLAVNFFGFSNREIGLIYQREFYKGNFNVVIPFSIGIGKPALTESVYYSNETGSTGLKLDRKLFDIGFGLNYYPSLRLPVNYYIGPSVKYIQYAAQQNYTYASPPTSGFYGIKTISKNTILSSYCSGITNGLIFRTRSRLMFNLFGTLGIRSDELSNTITDPTTNAAITTLRNAVSLYFGAGFAAGFTF